MTSTSERRDGAEDKNWCHADEVKSVNHGMRKDMHDDNDFIRGTEGFCGLHYTNVTTFQKQETWITSIFVEGRRVASFQQQR